MTTRSPPEMVLAFACSLDRLDVALHDPLTQWRWEPRAYANNWLGYQELKRDLLAELEAAQPVQLTAVGESTGPYWWHTFYHLGHDPELAAFTPQLALLNPAHVKHYRQALSEQDKTDPDDARLIAHY